MKPLRILVVDDSPFSQKIMTGLLQKAGFSVCGCADTGSQGLEKYRELRPDVVTMDMTLPDMDGLECSKGILLLEPTAKVIMVSAMKDEALMTNGYSAGVKGFIQKPPRGEELAALIHKVCQDEEETSWSQKYLAYFEQSLQENLSYMVGVESAMNTELDEESKFLSQGVAVIIGLTGKNQGRVILDSSEDTAQQLTRMILGCEEVSEEDMLNGMAELANIVSGNGVSAVNNAYRELELRLTPPSILSGRKINIVNPKLDAYIVTAQTPHGAIRMSVGFAGGK